MKRSRLLIAIVLGLGLTLALLWMLRGTSGPALAQSGLALVPPSLTRQHTPVVITGGHLSDLTGSPLGEVFVYAYQGTTPTQIPFQIDERDGSGMYATVEDGQLDDNDELVFMAIDGGSWVDNPSLAAGGMLITPTYVITLTDPISDTHAWAYVFCSAALNRTFTADYVSYDDGNDRITSSGRYTLGFNADHGFLDYLALGDGSPNLLDRSKLRITGTLYTTPFSFNEEKIAQDGIHTIDGPVRVTRVSTSTFSGQSYSATLFAYRSLVVRPETVVVPGSPAQVSYLRISKDWNEQALGMIYYDANNPAGVTIDGEPDSGFFFTPATTWTQVTSVTGTVVNVSNIPAGLGGSQSTYYRDYDSPDSNDTGDWLSYGDAGLQVDNPDPGTYTTLGHIYFPTGTTANVGATYVEYYDNPLQTNVAAVPARWYVHLPLVVKN